MWSSAPDEYPLRDEQFAERAEQRVARSEPAEQLRREEDWRAEQALYYTKCHTE